MNKKVVNLLNFCPQKTDVFVSLVCMTDINNNQILKLFNVLVNSLFCLPDSTHKNNYKQSIQKILEIKKNLGVIENLKNRNAPTSNIEKIYQILNQNTDYYKKNTIDVQDYGDRLNFVMFFGSEARKVNYVKTENQLKDASIYNKIIRPYIYG